MLTDPPVSFRESGHTSESTYHAKLNNYGKKIDSHVPDGGIMAWLQVFGTWSAAVMAFSMSSRTGVLIKWLKVKYLKYLPPFRVGWVFSVQLFIFYFMGVFLGPLIDAYGAHIFIITGSVGWVAAIFILSAHKKYYQFVLCYSILGGFSSSLLFDPSVTVLTHWFNKHRGLAFGISASGSGVSGIMLT